MALRSTGDTLLRGNLDTSRTFEWLADDPRPLDWNGPADRPFTRFRDQDLQRPIIEHFERVARRQPDRIAIRDEHAALTFGDVWDGVSGLAETLSAETKPGDLIGILLPACPMFPLAMLACLASARPFVTIDPHLPPDWLDHVLRDARPNADHHIRRWPPGCRGSDASSARHPSDGLAQTRAQGLATRPHGRGRTRVCPVHVRQHRAAQEHRE
jgi:hypothetical protein